MYLGTKTFLTTLLLVLIGILMVYSASCIWCMYKFNNPYFYLQRQLIFAALGFFLMYFVSNIEYHTYYKYSKYIFLFTLLLLILVLIPGIGLVRGGARSWIGIGQFTIQPSEFTKLGLTIFLSKYLSDYYQDIKKIKNVIFVVLLILCVFGLIMLQPDFGTGLVLVASMSILLFVAGINLKYIVYAIIGGIIGVVLLVISAPYRLERITAYMDPWSDPLGSGFQSIQALYALVPGGFFGVGLFQSRQKFYYLPEPQTDFIFAIIVEELGLVGGIVILCLFLYLIYLGIIISLRSKDLFAQYVSLGITSLLFIQVFVNIGVVIGLLPVTGITLPLISYGGSSLTLTLVSIGILLNISKHCNDDYSLKDEV